LNAFHVFRIEWTTTGFKIYVDGALKTSIDKVYSSPLVFMASDVNADATNLSWIISGIFQAVTVLQEPIFQGYFSWVQVLETRQ
jgi:hypothetical protein